VDNDIRAMHGMNAEKKRHFGGRVLRARGGDSGSQPGK
jgi:hypothetical protein